jgi:DUF4097 and DUF4098 domain-containing protein YvlB
MLKVGRYTAALLLVSVGIMLLLDQTTGSDHLALLLDWWPVILILLGVEYLIFNFIFHKGERQLRLDMGGLILSVLISAVVVGTTQSDRVPTDWLKNLDFNIDTLNLSFSSESGHRFDKELLQIPVSGSTKRVIIENPNGSVEIHSGSVQEIEIQTVVWVDKVDEAEARSIADQSGVEHTDGNQLRITAKGQEYTGGFPNKRKPRLNLVITVPESLAADYELDLRNGKVEAHGVAVVKEFKAHTTNGAISMSEINGRITAETTNGSVEVSQIGGNASINTTNGTVTAKYISGGLTVDTTNGAVSVEDVKGDLGVETLNGKITVREAAAAVKADATNGAISVHTSVVGGDYELDNMTSSIELRLPEDADVEIKGSTSYGSISTDLPLTVDGKKISGILGSGKHQIKIDTNNKIQVNRID